MSKDQPHDSPYQPIICGTYDFVELACLHRKALDITLADGSRVIGTAITTQTEKDGECLSVDTGNETRLIRLDQIQTPPEQW